MIIDAAKEVGPSLFFSLLVITVGFLPVFTLEDQAGRLFKPLAYTKTFSMLFASFLAITLTPVLMTLFIKGKIRHEDDNPISRFLRRSISPLPNLPSVSLDSGNPCGHCCRVTIFPFSKLGSEFMPPFYEGTLFLPQGCPASITSVGRLLQLQDRILMQFPEVESVFGKAGRAETPTDPAPLEMFETIVNLKPEKEWRPQFRKWEDLRDELDNALQIPGVANTWTMPIIGRIDVLSTGIRTPSASRSSDPVWTRSSASGWMRSDPRGRAWHDKAPTQGGRARDLPGL